MISLSVTILNSDEPLLLGITQKYRNSRFTEACIEYGNLKGFSYFGGEPRPNIIRDLNASKTPTERIDDWQDWIDQYPDHPGADDASLILGAIFAAQKNTVKQALSYSRAIFQDLGDGDKETDIGNSFIEILNALYRENRIEEIETLRQEFEDTSLSNIVTYYLAVYYVNEQNYGEALRLAKNINFTELPNNFFGKSSLYEQWQDDFVWQYRRWQKLAEWQADATPKSMYRIASDWARQGANINGQFVISGNFRFGYYERSNVPILLFSELINAPTTPPDILEKSLIMRAWQKSREQDFLDETIATLEADFPESRYIDDLLFSSYFYTEDSSYLEKLVEFYPDEDRAEEAIFLLQHMGNSHRLVEIPFQRSYVHGKLLIQEQLEYLFKQLL